MKPSPLTEVSTNGKAIQTRLVASPVGAFYFSDDQG
jgi:hypothetical protein